MKISYNWIKQFINLKDSSDETAKLLTERGLEVEGVSKFESVKGGLKNVVIGKVISCEKHPNADRLKVTSVNVGEKQNLQIVCGAPNVKSGQTVAVAKVGAKLYFNDKEITIKKSKIRGESSQGMICAEDELGLGSSHDGIIVFKKDLFRSFFFIYLMLNFLYEIFIYITSLYIYPYIFLNSYIFIYLYRCFKFS